MEGSGRPLDHFQMPEWSNKRNPAMDYEATHGPIEYLPEIDRDYDEPTITTNRLKKFSNTSDLKNPKFKKCPPKPSPTPLPTTEEPGNILPAGLEMEENGTGFIDDSNIETDTTEQDLENLLLLEGNNNKSERKTSARHNRTIEMDLTEQDLRNLILIERRRTESDETADESERTWPEQKRIRPQKKKKKESQPKNKTWPRKKKRESRMNIEGLVWPDAPCPPNTKRLPILLRNRDEEAGQKGDGEGGGVVCLRSHYH